MDKQVVKPLKRMLVVISLVALLLIVVGIIQYELLQTYILDLIHQLKGGK